MRPNYYPQSRGMAGLPVNHGPCEGQRPCVDYAIQQLRPHLQRAGCLPYSYQPLMAGLMGAVPQLMPPVAPGASAQFGFNVGYFNNELYRPEEIAPVVEAAGLLYDAHSYHVAGYLDPYLTVEGKVRGAWDSGSDLGNAIYNAISGAGYPIKYDSIQFRVQASYPSGYQQPVYSGTPYPNTQTTQTQQQQNQNQTPLPPGECDWDKQSFGDWIACQLGITSPIGGVGAGAVGALLGVGVVTLLAVTVLKR